MYVYVCVCVFCFETQQYDKILVYAQKVSHVYVCIYVCVFCFETQQYDKILVYAQKVSHDLLHDSRLFIRVCVCMYLCMHISDVR
jgi:hypothetical protein